MDARQKRLIFLSFVIAISAGCSSTSSQQANSPDLVRINREQAVTIKSLDKEVQRLNAEIQKISQVQSNDLQKTKTDLESGLKDSVQSGDLAISMEEKGLVVTVLDRVLFDPGKAGLRPEAQEALSTVAQVLNGEVKEHIIYIEGHTDDQPIRRSAWRSNWELSMARATEVLHYFIEQGEVAPERLAATGYGEYHPVVSNETPAGRMKNRRVEIVISPKKMGE